MTKTFEIEEKSKEWEKNYIESIKIEVESLKDLVVHIFCLRIQVFLRIIY